MALQQVIFRYQDAESNPRLTSVPVWAATGAALADYQAMAQALVLKLDPATESKLVDIQLVVTLPNPGGVKANAVAAALNERGGLIGFDTSGEHADSFRIPAILHTIMSGDEFSTANPTIADLITQLNLTVNTLRPLTRNGDTFENALYGKKSFRRK